MTHQSLRSTTFLVLAAALATGSAFAADRDAKPTGPLALVTDVTKPYDAHNNSRAVETPGMAGVFEESAAKAEGPLALVTDLTETTRARQSRAVGAPDAGDLLR